ncbi:hypothetical protein DL96DRAFT_1716220 [Flagelloscypha sp. PMI_526]|nr:hypothetical protein DL96DRAFT_1716220 [Flagelloscypha sp. PMI_526]
MASLDLPPAYTSEPIAIPIIGLADVPRGTYTEQKKDVVLTLFDQRPNTKGGPAPVYGRGSTVRGEVGIIGKTEKVEKVLLKLEGFVKLDVYDGFGSKEEVLGWEKVLFSRDTARPPVACPPKTDFQFTLPTEHESERPLPPTYETPCKGISDLYAKVYYRLVVSVHSRKILGKADSVKILTIDIDYYPRTSPPLQPIRTYENFDAAEGWQPHSRLLVIKQPSPNQELRPVTIEFYVPSVRTFGITDSIPFHITLTGSSPAIDEFLPPSYDSNSLSRTPSSSSSGTKPVMVKMKVSIARVITVKSNNPGAVEELTRETTIGEASVLPLETSQTKDGLIKLDYGGEVNVNHWAVKTGTFEIVGLSLKDYVVLAVNPVTPGLIPRKVAIPIKLVTDPWVDGRTDPTRA